MTKKAGAGCTSRAFKHPGRDVTAPDVWPSILTDYTYDSELDNADGVPLASRRSSMFPEGNPVASNATFVIFVDSSTNLNLFYYNFFINKNSFNSCSLVHIDNALILVAEQNTEDHRPPAPLNHSKVTLSRGTAICSWNMCMFSPAMSSVSTRVHEGYWLFLARDSHAQMQVARGYGCAVELTGKSIWTQRVCAAESRPFPKVNEPIVNQITSCDWPAMIRDVYTYRERERDVGVGV